MFGALQGALALPVLAIAGIVPAALGLLALLLYVGAYTPMKQRSHWATWVGGVPGAMPALMGWTAATGRIDLAGPRRVRRAVLLADPAHARDRASIASASTTPPASRRCRRTHGVAAARRAIRAFLVVQVAVSLAPALLGVAGLPYLVTAIVLGAMVLVQGFAGDGSHEVGAQRVPDLDRLPADPVRGHGRERPGMSCGRSCTRRSTRRST